MSSNDKHEFGIFTGDELFREYEEPEPLIDQLLNFGEVVCIAAKPKAGKSILVQQLAFNLTTGEPFLDTFKIARKCTVLYVQAEGKRNDTVRRFKNMQKRIACDRSKLFHINVRKLGLQTVQGIEELKKIARTFNVQYDVVILDPLYKLMYGGSLNHDKDTIMWTNHVDELLGEYGATGIVVHHDSEKEYVDKHGTSYSQRVDTLMGSTFWSGFFSHFYKLMKMKDQHSLILGVERSGDNIDKLPLKCVVPQNDSMGRLFFTQDSEDEREAYSKVRIILEREKMIYGKDVFYTGLTKDASKISRASFFRAIKSLEMNGLVKKSLDEHGKVVYVWAGVGSLVGGTKDVVAGSTTPCPVKDSSNEESKTSP